MTDDRLPSVSADGSARLLEITDEQYHADPCEVPSLSSTIASIIVKHSPYHAWVAHPKLNPDHRPTSRQTYDLGTLAHSLLLTDGAGLRVIDMDNWRTNIAKDRRDVARSEGLTPVLRHQYDEAASMIAAAQQQLSQHDDAADLLSADTLTEVPIAWTETTDDGVTHHRAKLDNVLVCDDGSLYVWDYKTTAGTANPHEWVKRAFDHGCDIQAAYYSRGLSALTGVSLDRIRFRFVVQERAEPWALSVVALDPPAAGVGVAKMEHAIDTWRSCMLSGRWPGYSEHVVEVEAPAWEQRWVGVS